MPSVTELMNYTRSGFVRVAQEFKTLRLEIAAGVGGAVLWTDIQSKPTVFEPIPASVDARIAAAFIGSTQVSDFVERTQDIVAATLANGPGISIAYDDVNNVITITNTSLGGGGGATGDVNGPAGATANALALFNGTTGKIIKDSAAVPSANGLSLVSAADYAAMRGLLTLVPGTNVQAFSAVLSTYAGIAPSANVQTVLGAANFGAIRTALSLVPGTDVLAFSANLSALNVASTAFGRSLLNAADAAGARALTGAEQLGVLPVATAKTASWTLGLGDQGFLTPANHATVAIVATVPPNATVAFPIGARLDIGRYGAADTSVAAGVGVTIRSEGGNLKASLQYTVLSLVKIGTDEWWLMGNLKA